VVASHVRVEALVVVGEVEAGVVGEVEAGEGSMHGGIRCTASEFDRSRGVR
jgi:hypothetical protein